MEENSYVSWSDNIGLEKALAAYSEATEESRVISRRQDYSDLAPNTSARPPFTRQDYEWFRPDEQIPTKHSNIVKLAESAYQRVGMVRNIIDLMGDFGCQGIRLVHRNKKIQKFYRNWFERIKGCDRSERFLNNLYRLGNIILQRQVAKVNKKERDKFFKSVSEVERVDFEDIPKLSTSELPSNYLFLNPANIERMNGGLESFSGKPRFSIKISPQLRKLINYPRNKRDKEAVASLPVDVKKAAKQGKDLPLDEDHTLVFYYKKDDWQDWAFPMTYSLFNNLFLLQKLELADVAALDGVTSKVRIFKLGDLEHQIIPTNAAFAKMGDLLESNVGGGTIDIVWGPDIEMIESDTNAHEFLGKEKYQPTIDAIYEGLGIPNTLTGQSNTGTTNNFMALRTLTERLKYGRGILNRFWSNELIIIQKTMGFAQPATVEYDHMNLGDENAERALLIQMADRNLISDELLQERFGHNSEIEKHRINREFRERRQKSRPDKSSPWHDTDKEHSLRKIALTGGSATPSEVGLELLENKDEFEPVGRQGKEENNNTGVAGRPTGKKDGQERKRREFKPKAKATISIFARQTYDKIREELKPFFLKYYDKKNMRSLSHQQAWEAENITLRCISIYEPFAEFNKQKLTEIDKANLELINMVNQNKKIFIKYYDRDPSQEEFREIIFSTFADYHTEE